MRFKEEQPWRESASSLCTATFAWLQQDDKLCGSLSVSPPSMDFSTGFCMHNYTHLKCFIPLILSHPFITSICKKNNDTQMKTLPRVRSSTILYFADGQATTATYTESHADASRVFHWHVMPSQVNFIYTAQGLCDMTISIV